MRTLITFCLAMLMGVGFAVAQTGGQITPELQPKDGASIAWDKEKHDFQNVPQNVPATVTFSFVNDTGAPVLITDVKTSCGCTTPHYTNKPIPPGGTGEVKASYNAKKLGHFTKTVTVTTDAGENGTRTVLTLMGNVVEQEG